MTRKNYVPFSERHGYVRKALQIESIDIALKNGLWNVFTRYVWGESTRENRVSEFQAFVVDIWENHFRERHDDLREKLSYGQIQPSYGVVRLHIRERFFDSDWCGVYDFLDFIAVNYANSRFIPRFTEACNLVLQREKSAYRFVSGRIAPITNEMEIEAIESSARVEGPVAIQLRNALEKLSDRKAPDYRNSVKESIAAVESQARRILKAENATLGKLLIEMERNYGLPKPIKEAFSALYGYASGPSGVRHGPVVAEGMEVGFDLAKFMLVACSAFINFAATLAEPYDLGR